MNISYDTSIRVPLNATAASFKRKKMPANKYQQHQRLGLYRLLTSLSKASTCGKAWLFTIHIHMGKLVGSRFGQGAKFKSGKFRPGIAGVYYLYKSVPFTAKRARTPGTYWYERWLWRIGTRIFVWNIPSGITELPFQTFPCSWKFSSETTRKVVFHFTFKPNFSRSFCKWLTTSGHQSTTHLGQKSGIKFWQEPMLPVAPICCRNCCSTWWTLVKICTTPPFVSIEQRTYLFYASMLIQIDEFIMIW